MENYFLVVIITSFFLYGSISCLLIVGIARHKPGKNTNKYPVSIIVTARNEEKNITRCLKSLVQQNYPVNLVEIIVVNDRSTDRTGEVIDKFASKYPTVKQIWVKKTASCSGYKKHALGQGIAASTGELLLFTDADCQPSVNWITSIVSYFTARVGVVVGFSPLKVTGKKWWTFILTIDSIAAAVVAAGSIGLKNPITATGRNIAYRRRVYDDVGGFAEISHSISGDDDLFVQLVHQKTRWQMVYAMQPGTVVPALAPGTILQFFRQKKRHISAGRYFSIKIKMFYALYHLCNFCLWTGLLTAIFFSFYPGWIAIAKIFIDWCGIHLFANRLKLVIKYSAFFMWQPFFLIYHLAAGPAGLVGKIKWKD